MNKRILSLIIAMILSLTAFGCVSFAEEAPVELTIAVPTTTPNPIPRSIGCRRPKRPAMSRSTGSS